MLEGKVLDRQFAIPQFQEKLTLSDAELEMRDVLQKTLVSDFPQYLRELYFALTNLIHPNSRALLYQFESEVKSSVGSATQLLDLWMKYCREQGIHPLKGE